MDAEGGLWATLGAAGVAILWAVVAAIRHKLASGKPLLPRVRFKTYFSIHTPSDPPPAGEIEVIDSRDALDQGEQLENDGDEIERERDSTRPIRGRYEPRRSEASNQGHRGGSDGRRGGDKPKPR
jgi:hypothetical protein